jgi:hypothetical protein
VHRLFGTNTLGMILAAVSWILIIWIVSLLVRMIANGSGWTYLD